jgi:hypothetical protein
MNNEIRVVILCGGTGTRLREETEYRPKPMVEIGGRPVLWHIMKIYAQHGYNRLILCLGGKGRIIKEGCLDLRTLNGEWATFVFSGGLPDCLPSDECCTSGHQPPKSLELGPTLASDAECRSLRHVRTLGMVA